MILVCFHLYSRESYQILGSEELLAHELELDASHLAAIKKGVQDNHGEAIVVLHGMFPVKQED